MTGTAAEEFEAQRPRLFGLAYRLLGSAMDAEDVVKDAYLRETAQILELSEANCPDKLRFAARQAMGLSHLKSPPGLS